MITQRKMKAQPPLSDAYLHGMPAKRRKVIRSDVSSLITHECHMFCIYYKVCVFLSFQTGQGGGSLLSLSDAVSQAARTAGVKPITSAERLQDDLETQELKEAYAEQVTEAYLYPKPGTYCTSFRLLMTMVWSFLSS